MIVCLVIAILLPLAGALVSPLRGRRSPALAALFLTGASAFGLAAAVPVMMGWVGPIGFSLPSAVPLLELSFRLDALSAWFWVITLLLLPFIGALAGEYVRSISPRRVAICSTFLCLLAFSLTLILLANQAILFLFAWEGMTISTLMLVLAHDHRKRVARAGWLFLVMSQVGVTFLMVFFFMANPSAGSLEFSILFARGSAWGLPAAALFLAALIGFGTKAGVFPLFGWIPEADPAAPDHIAALMSGMLVKMGIYGILRAYIWLSPLPPWVGPLLAALGGVGALYGVILALAQRHIKRLLAYSSIENVGLIVMGLGLGMSARQWGHPFAAALAFGGALFHVWNHAIFKTLLFLLAGLVQNRAGGQGDMNRLGGMLRLMPRVGNAFLVAAAAICALPPFNGFVSEFILYIGAFNALSAGEPALRLTAVGCILALSIVSGLVLATFVKAFSIIFLGTPRSAYPPDAPAPGGLTLALTRTLTLACFLIGVFAPLMPRLLFPVVYLLFGPNPPTVHLPTGWESALFRVTTVTAGLLIAWGIIAWLHRKLLEFRNPGQAPTWDCGYTQTTPAMQYTADSITGPLTSFFKPLLRTRRRRLPVGAPAAPSAPAPLTTYYPPPIIIQTQTPDPLQRRLIDPIFSFIFRLLNPVRRLQHGSLHLYVLYIAIALLIVMILALRGPAGGPTP